MGKPIISADSQAAHLTAEERDLVLHDNVAELYQLGGPA
jgi:hypothetical protein